MENQNIDESLNESNPRLRYLRVAAIIWFSLICLRLFWLQVIQFGNFTLRAKYQQERTIEVSPVRGNIYDRNGNELALTVTSESIFAVPSEIADIHTTAMVLGRVLQSDPQDIENRMRASHAFAWVARKTEPSVSRRVRQLDLRGIYFQKEAKRGYPKHELAAQVIGYVGLDDIGLGGLERQFDSVLTGKPGMAVISMDAKHRWLGKREKAAEPGENMVLTIDEKIQYIAERELLEAIRDTNAEGGTIIVENPHTGDILALANWPSFDPNSLKTANPSSLKNRAVSDIYEPGSAFKVVTLAAALEEKLTNPEEVVDCQMGSIVVGSLRIHDHKPFGALTIAQILEHSSDVGAIKIALRLGEERLDRYIRTFGFGSQTGIELPGETRGLTKPPSRWSRVSIGAIAMGQEIGVSPVQFISMASAIANDGVYVPPRIVAAITRHNTLPSPLFWLPPTTGRRVISSTTAAQLKRMLEGVILSGTGKKAILDGYSTAGKTGTAQKIDPLTGTYSRWRFVASFVGFAPINQPAISVLVILDSPVGVHDGGLVAAPVFSRVAQRVLAYLDIAHDVEVRDERVRQILRARAADGDLSDGAPDYIAQEDATVAVMPLPRADSAVRRTQASSLVPPADSPPEGSNLSSQEVSIVPNLLGKSLREAALQAQVSELELNVVGHGVVRSQSPQPGARVLRYGQVNVVLK